MKILLNNGAIIAIVFNVGVFYVKSRSKFDNAMLKLIHSTAVTFVQLPHLQLCVWHILLNECFTDIPLRFSKY